MIVLQFKARIIRPCAMHGNINGLYNVTFRSVRQSAVHHRKMLIWRSGDMTSPAELRHPQLCIDTGYINIFNDLSVGNLILPLDF